MYIFSDMFQIRMCKILDKSEKFLFYYSNLLWGPLFPDTV